MQYGDSLTLQGIREDIYYLAKANTASINPNDLQRIINKYYGQLQEAVRSVNENFYMVVAIANLSALDGTYTYPDGSGTNAAPAYEKMKSIWAAFKPANVLAPLVTEFSRVNCIDPSSISDPSYSFTQPTAMMFGNYFVLTPFVDNISVFPVTNGLKCYYIARQQALILDTDVPVIFPTFTDAITQGSLIDVAQRMGNDKLKADSERYFAKRLSDIKQYASDRLPLLLGLVEGQDNTGGWTYPFGQDSMA
jgi:hypothetical protein